MQSPSDGGNGMALLINACLGGGNGEAIHHPEFSPLVTWQGSALRRRDPTENVEANTDAVRLGRGVYGARCHTYLTTNGVDQSLHLDQWRILDEQDELE